MENHSHQILEKPIEWRRVCQAAISYDLRKYIGIIEQQKERYPQTETSKKEYDYGFPISGPLKAANH